MMKTNIYNTRKHVLKNAFILCLLILVGTACSDDDDAPMPGQETMGEATITLENVGANAYVISAIEGEGAMATTGTENPALNLMEGGRYTFVNNAGASSHPLNFRDGSSAVLLGQGNNAGSFGEDEAVDLVRSGDNITFTLTPELAAELSEYICAFHPGMKGSIMVME